MTDTYQYGSALRAALAQTRGSDPEQEAEIARAARATGAAPSALRAMPREQWPNPAPFDVNTFLNDYPRTAGFLSTPANAAVARDSIPGLSEMERILAAGPFAGQRLVAPTAPAPSIGSVFRGLASSFLNTGRLVVASAEMQAAEFFGQEAPDATRRASDAQYNMARMRPGFENPIARGIYSGAESLVQAVPIIAGTIATRNPLLGVAAAGAVAETTAYPRYRERGATVGEAALGATGEGAVEGATALLPMGFLVNRFGKIGTRAFLAGILAREALPEQIATLTQDAIDTAIANPDKTWAQYAAERPDAAVQTLIATVTQSLATAGASSATHAIVTQIDRRTADAQAGEAGTAIAENIAAMANNSVVRERDPETFSNFMAQAAEDGPVENIYVDAVTLNQSLADAGVDVEALSAAVPAIGEQLQAAVNSGGDLVIPVEQFATLIAGTDAEGPLIDHLRVDPSLPSRAETKAVSEAQVAEVQAEAERVLSAEETTTAFRESAARVKAQFVEQLGGANRFTGDVNEAYASVVSASYVSLASRLGMTPEEAAAKYPLQIVAEAPSRPADTTLDQEQETELVHFSDNAGLAMSDPSKWGASSATSNGERARRNAGAPGRTYFGVRDVYAGESAVGISRRPFQYSARVPSSKLYDFDADPQGLRGQLDATGYEQAIQAAGFAGYRSDATVPGAVALFDPTELRAEGPLRTNEDARRVQTRARELEAIWSKAMVAGTVSGPKPDFRAQAMAEMASIPAQPQNEIKTETPAFKAWFGDSKVVDADGNPLVVYHGTMGDFEAFDPELAGYGSSLGEGFYFSNSQADVAANYARQGSDATQRITMAAESIAGNTNRDYDDPAAFEEARAELKIVNDGLTIPAYLSLQNPVVLGGERETIFTGEQRASLLAAVRDVMDAEYFGGSGDVLAALEGAGNVGGERLVELLDSNGVLGRDIGAIFRSAGFDGVIDHTVGGKFRMPGLDERTTHYIAFSPTQIKSVFNRGTFDPADPFILNQSERTPGQIEERAQQLANEIPGLKAVLPLMSSDEKAKLRKDTAAKIVRIIDTLPSAEEMAAVAYSGRAKKGWYENSAKAILEIFGAQDAPRFAALLAALSPQTSVEANLFNALASWTNWINAGRPQDRREIVELLGKSVQGKGTTESVLGAWINNSVTALTTENPAEITLSGPKVNSFMLNLVGVVDEVTNDAWMANYALVEQSLFKKTGAVPGKGPGYIAMSTVARRAAEIVSEKTGDNWSAAEVQETVWSWAKTLYETRDSAGETRTTQQILDAGELTAEEIGATPDFALLFTNGVYRRILTAGGYGERLEALEGSGQAAYSDGDRGDPRSAEGTAFAEDDFRALLGQAAGRLEQLRSQRRGAAQPAEQFTLFQSAAPVDYAPVEGAPGPVKVNGERIQFGPFAPAREAAYRYMADRGVQYQPPTVYAKVDPERAKRIADAYDAMAHAPNDPQVRAAYRALIDETLAQWKAIEATGLEVEFIDFAATGDPYAATPRMAILDVTQNNHLWVFPTDDGFGSDDTIDVSDNPMLEMTDVYINGRQLRANDVFRIVHDYYGHIKDGFGFRADGEENAYQSHAAMYSPLARKAAATETRGQNSWVNYGPHAAHNKTASGGDTIYAPQKVGLLPDWAVDEGALFGKDSGTVAGERPAETYAQTNPPFYSALAKAVEQSQTKRASAEQWKATLAKAPGVKKDEIEWSGVNDWLDGQVGAVDRETLSTYLAQGFPLFQQNRGQITFGADLTQSPTVISLLRTADLSTFVHEMGHFQLQVMAQVASSPDAPADIVDDVNALLNWFRPGMTLEEWNAMSPDEKRPYHETFARGTEAYYREGKAPTVELQPLFQRLRTWLLSVYKELAALNVELTDEVRQVMGRMLASQEAIAETEQARGLTPMLETKPDTLSEEAWAEYQRNAKIATEDALDELGARTVRDMQWLSNAKSREMKRLQATNKDQRKIIKAEVTAEVMAEPVNRARLYLRRGVDAEGVAIEGAGKLDLAALQAQYGTETTALWRGLKVGGKFGEAGNEGLNPDAVAEQFGFESGDALVRALVTAEDMNAKIAGITDQRMLERFGDITDEQSLERAANEAVANGARVRMVATEMAITAQLTGQPRALAAVARQVAAGIVNRLQMKRLKPAQFMAAQARAAVAADKAHRKGDVVEAAKQKRFQLINLQAARYAMKAQEEVDKALKLFTRIVSAKDDALARSYDMNLVNAARAILAMHGIGRVKNQPSQYLDMLSRYEPTLYADIKPFVDAAALGAKPVHEMTYEEFQGLRDTVRQLWKLARTIKTIEIDGQRMALDSVREQLGARLDELKPGQANLMAEDPTEFERDVRGLSGIRAALRRVESWVRGIDGGDTGVFRTYLWNPISEAAARYRTAQATFIERYLEILKPIEATLTQDKIAAPELGFTFKGRQQLLHAILHTGNQSNKAKLLLGRGWGRRLEDGSLDTTRWDAFVARMAAEGKLTRADYDVAQQIWDLLEETKPAAQKAHLEMYGRYFDEVTADEFDTPFGTYRGGYVPALTDSFHVQDAAIRQEENALAESQSGMFPAASNGFTKARVEDYTRELALDMGLLPMHIDKVLKFTHLGPPVRNAVRILKGRAFSAKLQAFDPVAQTDLLLPWLQRAATQVVEVPATGWAGRATDKAFRTIRSRVGMQLMFANVSNTVQQLTGFSSLAVRVKKRNLQRALWAMTRNPKAMAATAAEKSAFMATRTSSQVYEMRQTIDQLLLNPNSYEKARDFAKRHGYFTQQAFQNFADLVGWHAAYDMAIARGDSEKEAVRFADSVIRETQGSMAAEDVAKFESGTAFHRLFTQFLGYSNMTANLNATEIQVVARGIGVKKGAGRLFYVYLMGFAIPALMADAIAQAFRGTAGDEDDDGYLDDFLEWFFGSQTRFALSMVPVVGQITSAALGGFTEKPFDDKISTNPTFSVLESSGRVPSQIAKSVFEGESFDRRDIRDTMTLLGLVTGLPLGTLGKPVGYQAGVMQGDIVPTDPLDHARGLLTGAPSEESKVD